MPSETTPNHSPITGIRRVMSSAKVQTALVTVVGMLLTILNVDPAKQKLWLTFIAGVFALTTAVIWAWGYEDGKANEGTVPEGRVPATGNVQVNTGSQATNVQPPPTPAADEPPAVTAAQLAQIVAAIRALNSQVRQLQLQRQTQPPAETGGPGIQP